MKTIKFDLPIDEVQVKDIEELREHFTPEILSHYRNGTLVRWLSSRKFHDELEKVEALDGREDYDTLKGLYEIFRVVANDEIISAALREPPSPPEPTLLEWGDSWPVDIQQDERDVNLSEIEHKDKKDISGVLRIAKDETKIFENLNVEINDSFIYCEGSLVFIDCEIEIKDDDSEINLTEEARLSFSGCNIDIVKYRNKHIISAQEKSKIEISNSKLNNVSAFSNGGDISIAKCKIFLIKNENFKSFYGLNIEDSDFFIEQKNESGNAISKSVFEGSIFKSNTNRVFNTRFKAEECQVDNADNAKLSFHEIQCAGDFIFDSASFIIDSCRFENLSGLLGPVNFIIKECCFTSCENVINTFRITCRPRNEIQKTTFESCNYVGIGGSVSYLECTFDKCNNILFYGQGVDYKSCTIKNMDINTTETSLHFLYDKDSGDSTLLSTVFENVTVSNSLGTLIGCEVFQNKIVNEKPVFFVKVESCAFVKCSTENKTHGFINEKYKRSGVFKDTLESGIHVSQCKGLTSS